MTDHSAWKNIQRSYKTRQTNVYTTVAKEVANEIGVSKNPITQGHNDERDAFRHAYISALTTYRYGENPSEFLGYLNEVKNNGKAPASEECQAFLGFTSVKYPYNLNS